MCVQQCVQMAWCDRLYQIMTDCALDATSANHVEDIYQFCHLLMQTKDNFTVFSMRHHQQALSILRAVSAKMMENPEVVLFTSLFEQQPVYDVAHTLDPILVQNPIFAQYVASPEYANQQRFHIQVPKLEAIRLATLLQRYPNSSSEKPHGTRTPWSSVPSDESMIDLYLLHSIVYKGTSYAIQLKLAGEYEGGDSAMLMREIQIC